MDTLFRGNTIACKVLSCSFKTFGLYYLQAVVRPLILQLLKSVDKDYEVDPTRLTDPSKLVQNQANLLELVQTFFETIVTSLASIPLQLRTVCHTLYSVSSMQYVVKCAWSSVQYVTFICAKNNFSIFSILCQFKIL